MKKILAVILSILYLTATTGTTLHFHYCMGKLADWGLGNEKSKTCGKCGMEKIEGQDNGCCRDEERFVKNTIDQKTPETAFYPASLTSVLPGFLNDELNKYNIHSAKSENRLSYDPLRSSDVAVYLRICVFRI